MIRVSVPERRFRVSVTEPSTWIDARFLLMIMTSVLGLHYVLFHGVNRLLRSMIRT
jgi:hypothetical protein